jgi:very-short-patch-repair endonuclease
MAETTLLMPNVLDFLNKASNDYGRIQAEQFSQDMYCMLVDSEITSPIEHIFFVALHVIAQANYVELNPEPIECRDGWARGPGIHLYSQFKVSKYKVDFLLENVSVGSVSKTFAPVIVELDGHDFHDKDKAQRAYEKARDRHLVKNGYRVLHFTGSEVVKDPYKVAHEVLELIGAIGSHQPEPYDPKNPFGID